MWRDDALLLDILLPDMKGFSGASLRWFDDRYARVIADSHLFKAQVLDVRIKCRRAIAEGQTMRLFLSPQ
jgi:hypothetical protein